MEMVFPLVHRIKTQSTRKKQNGRFREMKIIFLLFDAADSGFVSILEIFIL